MEYSVLLVLSFTNSTLVNKQKSLGRQYTEKEKTLKDPRMTQLWLDHGWGSNCKSKAATITQFMYISLSSFSAERKFQCKWQLLGFEELRTLQFSFKVCSGHRYKNWLECTVNQQFGCSLRLCTSDSNVLPLPFLNGSGPCTTAHHKLCFLKLFFMYIIRQWEVTGDYAVNPCHKCTGV